MGDRPILRLKKKAPAPVAVVVPVPVVEATPLSPQKLASAARAAAAEIEYREKAAAIALARPVFETYFYSLPVVQGDKPLAINVFYAFRNWLREQPVAANFTNKMLQRTIEPVIADHVIRPVYLTAVVNETHRYNVDGSLANPIEEQHKAGATKKLAKLEKKARKQAEGIN